MCTIIPFVAHAQVRITEIMYDLVGTDTGREWIEVKNISAEPVDLSTWKLFEANTNHKLNPLSSPVIPPGGYAVIIDAFDKFTMDNSNFSGLLFDSAFSLGNEGETITVRNSEGVDIDSVSYSASLGAQGDGNTLQRKDDGTFISAAPTLGSATEATVSVPGSEEETKDITDKDDNSASYLLKNTDTLSTHSSQSVANISFDAPEFSVTTGRPRIGFVGTPLQFEAKIKTAKNIPIGNVAANVWSMGDGTAQSGQFISHVYEYPGEYTVVLNSSMGGTEAVSKVKVKILEPKVTVLSADASSIEIENKDTYELNVGGWSIETTGERKVLPQDTILAPRSRIRMPTRSLGLKHVDQYVKLINPAGRMLSSVFLATHQTNSPDDVLISLPPGVTVEHIKEFFKR